ncbi:MAG TPA: 3-hydroxybutyryl-CoA dehydrogenase [Negativicutes bacterium]|nr:3-hydroxybutyryl-CoA dehydrogenase [Negativicutes bacterium]
MQQINNVVVIGAGQMGAGIAQVAAVAGFKIKLYDVESGYVDRGLNNINKNLQRLAEKGKLTPAACEQTAARLTGVNKLAAAADADLIIEAAPESPTIKKNIFLDLDKICPAKTIFATNTSSIPITELAAVTKRADRFIGMHFAFPVPVMKMLELICGLETSADTFQAVKEAGEKMGKEAYRVNDFPGFCGNRIVIPMINEAIFALMESVATAEDIDGLLKAGYNHPMGPLALADLIGLDTVLAIMEVLYNGYKDPKYRPCPLLKKMVQAGYLGRKAGRGFYSYQ